MDDQIPPYPLYANTYQLYRISPLHHGDQPLLRDQTLQTHARRLRDQLKGDNVRGVDVDFIGPESTLAKYGPLEECNWDLLGDEDAYVDRQRLAQGLGVEQAPDASQLSMLDPDKARGIEIALDYERHSYRALLLRDPETATSTEGFTALPLLMTSMPASIREIVLTYLKTAFDVHIAPLRLQSTFLTSTLESYFRRLAAPTSAHSLKDAIRQLHIHLAFPNTSPLLGHIDVHLADADVAGFLGRGRLLPNPSQMPFTAAFGRYLQKHLALDLANPKLYISRISCSSFTMTTSSVKIKAPDIASDASFSQDGGSQDPSAFQLAVHDLYTSLVREATGTGKFLPENFDESIRSSTPSSVGSARGGRRKRAVSTTAASYGNAKRSRAPGKENGRNVDEQEAPSDDEINV